jgi:hypothetical protein
MASFDADPLPSPRKFPNRGGPPAGAVFAFLSMFIPTRVLFSILQARHIARRRLLLIMTLRHAAALITVNCETFFCATQGRSKPVTVRLLTTPGTQDKKSPAGRSRRG